MREETVHRQKYTMGKLGTHGARQPKAPKVKSKLQAATPSASSSNDAALRLKLEELTGGVDPEADDKAWVEALVVTSDKPLACDDPEVRVLDDAPALRARDAARDPTCLRLARLTVTRKLSRGDLRPAR